MYNPIRTLEVFGYDLNNKKRRSSKEAADGIVRKDLSVIDNCPSCNEERTIQFRQSKKNKPCSKCFHNSPEMTTIKLAQKGKRLTQEHKQALKDNHWSKNGFQSAFKDKHHTEEIKLVLAKKAKIQADNLRNQIGDFEFKVRMGLMKRDIERNEFNGFITSENTRIRQSPEGKVWTYDVLAKANFTCVKCNERGGKLHAHHKNGFNAFPEQRFDIDNGVCLCKSCHDNFHEVYGKGDNTQEQFDAWIKS